MKMSNNKKIIRKKLILDKTEIKNIKSKYVFQQIFDKLPKKRLFEIIHHNKKFQNKLDLTIKDFQEFSKVYSSIEIDIKPTEDIYGKFINILNKEEEPYFHIYFNNSQKEIKRNYLKNEEKIQKIKIIINHQVISFSQLFQDCKCIESIRFRKFFRTNINNMSYMLNDCSSLKDLDISKVITDKVTNMKGMFDGCSSLTNLDLSNFNTSNVTNMSAMFFRCSGLTKINLSKFNTNNVTDMSWMFFGCSKLEDLNVTHFNTEKVTNMSCMFAKCSSLKELNLSKFNSSNVIDVSGMFSGSKIGDLNISNFDCTKLKNSRHNFSKCSLSNINYSNIKVKDRESLFDLFDGFVSVYEILFTIDKLEKQKKFKYN